MNVCSIIVLNGRENDEKNVIIGNAFSSVYGYGG
jgi:hypothetical protein